MGYELPKRYSERVDTDMDTDVHGKDLRVVRGSGHWTERRLRGLR